MAKVYSIQVKADFLVLADDEQEAVTIASVLTDGINSELPGNSIADLYPYLIRRQDEEMRKQCVNYEGHAETVRAATTSEVVLPKCPHGATGEEVCPDCLGVPSDNPDEEIS
jgi:hypothetical protein